LLGVGSGSYSLLVTDGLGCSASVTASVGVSDGFVISGTVSDISCYGEHDGSVSVQVSEGSGSYSYHWNTGASGSSISGLDAGEYTVDVTDDITGCSSSASFTVTEPDTIHIMATVVNDTCTTVAADGKILLEVSGGTPPYAYAWSTGSNASLLMDLSAGEYSVTVSDDRGCSSSWSGVVQDADCDPTLNIYDVITPNGDGSNDSWVIDGLEYYPQNEVKVFDKWGDMVFSQKGYDGSWSGTRGTSGSALPAGTYFYVIRLNADNIQGGKNEFTGALLIQR
jgi:gliding motility-associated-like protein